MTHEQSFEPSVEDESPRLLSASSIIGDPIVNHGAKTLGTVKEIMLHVDTGTIAYVVLSRGGVMGVGERLYAVPWDMLDLDARSEALVLDMEPDVLDDAPGFDPDNWPDAIPAGGAFLP